MCVLMCVQLFQSATGFLQYLDVSVGKEVAAIWTRLGRLDVMAQNPSNAIIHLGHPNGTVSLWSPNQKEPLVKMLCHRGAVRSLAVDKTGRYVLIVLCPSEYSAFHSWLTVNRKKIFHLISFFLYLLLCQFILTAELYLWPNVTVQGVCVCVCAFDRYMVTSGLDRRLQVYDIRAFKPLHKYFLPAGASCLSLSQRGLLSAATGDVVQVHGFNDSWNVVRRGHFRKLSGVSLEITTVYPRFPSGVSGCVGRRTDIQALHGTSCEGFSMGPWILPLRGHSWYWTWRRVHKYDCARLVHQTKCCHILVYYYRPRMLAEPWGYS